MVQNRRWGPMLDSLYEGFGIVSSVVPGGLPTSPVDCIDLQIPWCNGVLDWKVGDKWLRRLAYTQPGLTFVQHLSAPLASCTVGVLA